ncbi:uncharacterized protein [Aristolochia californica]|uniref:uncharacterized protein n=1 Tax=Aristolochia californica TaxID=171875 RepID=UPI0035D8F3CF
MGLLMYSLVLSDIFETFASVDECFILVDITYGACYCVDDFSRSFDPLRIAVAGTIQFSAVVRAVKSALADSDGRFHLEVFMIANPHIRAFRYDLYLKVFFLEEYDLNVMKEAQKKEILNARKAKFWGIVVGMFGQRSISTSCFQTLLGNLFPLLTSSTKRLNILLSSSKIQMS